MSASSRWCRGYARFCASIGVDGVFGWLAGRRCRRRIVRGDRSMAPGRIGRDRRAMRKLAKSGGER